MRPVFSKHLDTEDSILIKLISEMGLSYNYAGSHLYKIDTPGQYCLIVVCGMVKIWKANQVRLALVREK